MANQTSVMAVIRAYRPTFRNPFDKVVFALHSSFLAAGYVLTAAGPSAFSPDACSDASADSEVGVEGWNESDDSYAFVYRKDVGGAKKVVLVKCLVIEDELAVDVLDCSAGREPLHLGIKVNAYVSDGNAGSSNYGSIYKDFGSLIKLFNTSVLEKLESTEEVASSKSTQTEKTERVDSRSIDFDEPVRSVEETFPSGFVVPPIVPFGGSDVFPNPGAGIYPSRGGLGTGGSMLVGPNDPRWGMSEPFGLPRPIPGVPPGARFDPFGPPDVVTGFEPRRNLPRRPGSHPDLEPFRDSFQPDFI